jgi:hypothetical protein
MSRSGERIATGTGAERRRLTLEQAEAGCLPEPFTADEWRSAYTAAGEYAEQLFAAGVALNRARMTNSNAVWSLTGRTG